MTFLEKLQSVNNYKNSIEKQKTSKHSDSNNSYGAIDKNSKKRDIVTEIRLCITEKKCL